jgi:hypothetical protein
LLLVVLELIVGVVVSVVRLRCIDRCWCCCCLLLLLLLLLLPELLLLLLRAPGQATCSHWQGSGSNRDETTAVKARAAPRAAR